MDKTVPAGAAILLDFIRKIEVGRVDDAYHGLYPSARWCLALGCCGLCKLQTGY
ncbi:hypothetical protein [Pseudochrobactrum sp. MP213Fo]|uniref:hypothetical protein n=1 Tax=Pseudochrobactrum sp. MP213Fo TaxID=3022250 RepID=UPI003BA1BA39